MDTTTTSRPKNPVEIEDAAEETVEPEVVKATEVAKAVVVVREAEAVEEAVVVEVAEEEAPAVAREETNRPTTITTTSN